MTLGAGTTVRDARVSNALVAGDSLLEHAWSTAPAVGAHAAWHGTPDDASIGDYSTGNLQDETTRDADVGLGWAGGLGAVQLHGPVHPVDRRAQRTPPTAKTPRWPTSRPKRIASSRATSRMPTRNS